MRYKSWLLKHYVARQGAKRIAKQVGISADELTGIVAKGMKVNSDEKELLLKWQSGRRYSKYTKKDFEETVRPVSFVRNVLTKKEALKFQKMFKERKSQRPKFRRIKKSLIRSEVRRKGLKAFSRESKIRPKEIENLLKYPYSAFLPKNKDVDNYVKYQKKFYESKRGQVISSALKLAKSDIKKYRLFANTDMRYFSTGTPYAVIYVPVLSQWISADDNPRIFDKIGKDIFNKIVTDSSFRKYASLTGSIFGKIVFEAVDDRDNLKWTIHESAPLMIVNNYNELRKEMLGMANYLADLAFIYVQGKEHYNHVRIMNVSVYMKLRDDFNVTKLRSKKKL